MPGGAADKLNPTDNINPEDLSDIWDFGRHLASNGVKTSIYFGETAMSIVYLPSFTPAVLPCGNLASVFFSPQESPPGITIRNVTDTLILPAHNLREDTLAGVKISRHIGGYDFSLSYVMGRDDLPLAQKITFTPTGTPGEADVSTELIFPRMAVTGIDAAGMIGGMGFWAEAAVVDPEKVTLITDLSDFGMGVQETEILGRPYVKYVIGTDYTFKNGIYFNAQYLHGFFHECGRDRLEDYLTGRVEWKSSDEKIVIPVSLCLEVKDVRNIRDNYAYVLSPELVCRPADNMDLVFGVRWIDGTNNSTFGKLKDNDEIYFQAKFSF